MASGLSGFTSRKTMLIGTNPLEFTGVPLNRAQNNIGVPLNATK
jgi:hypothetical protein